jgi:hypothetical protein
VSDASQTNYINAAVESTFRLGDFVFRLRCSDWELLHAMTRMLPSTHNSPDFRMDAPFHVIDLNAPADLGDGKVVDLRRESPSLVLSFIMNTALRYHEQFFWMEAATLIDQAERLTMLCGGTHSGKTTMALALHLLLGMKVVSEDLTIIDPADNEILSFARPLSLREGSFERIHTATNIFPDKQYMHGEWYFESSMYDYRHRPLQPRLIVFLKPLINAHAGPFEVCEMDPAALLKQLLPLSNLIRRSGDLDALHKAIEGAQCFSMQGGELSERVNWFQSLQLS